MTDREEPPGRKSTSAMRSLPGQERPSSRGRRAVAPTEQRLLSVKSSNAHPVQVAQVDDSAGSHLARITALEAELARQARDRDIEAEEHGALLARLMSVEERLRRTERERDARDAEIQAVRAELEAARALTQTARRRSGRPPTHAHAAAASTAAVDGEALHAMLSQAGTTRVAALIAEVQQRDNELFTLRADAYGAALDMICRLRDQANAVGKPSAPSRSNEAVTSPPPARKRRPS